MAGAANPLWWQHLLSHIGLTPSDIDTIDRDVDPIRAWYDRITGTVEEIRSHLNTDSPTSAPPHHRPIALASPNDMDIDDPPGVSTPSMQHHHQDPQAFQNMPNTARNRIAAARNAAESRGSRGGLVGDEEVPIIPPPKRLAVAAPDYFSIELPYYVTGHRANSKQNAPLAFFFKLNSIFDPQFTSLGTEHQPMGRDLWTGVYGYYRVLSSTFNVTCVNMEKDNAVTASSHPSFIAGLTPQEDTTSTILTREGLMESKVSQWQICHPIESNHHSASFKFHYSPEHWHFHVQETGIDERWTPIGDNPAIQHYACFHIANMFDGDVSPLNVQITIGIRFIVQFREANSTYIHQHDPQ